MKFKTLSEAMVFAREQPGTQKVYKLGLEFEILPIGLKEDKRTELITIENDKKSIHIHY